MINNCGCGGHDGSLSFNQRLKALEKAIAGYSSLVASDIVKANKAEVKEADIRDATIDKADITSATIDILKSDNIQAKFGSFDTIVAGKLNLTDPDIDVEYKNVTAENIKTDYIEAEDAHFDTITADYLNVKGLMDMFNMKRLFINGKKALTNESTDNNNALTIGEDFRQADFMTSLRPTWQNLPLALQSDVAGVFSMQGILASDADLPSNPADNDVYFIQQHQDATIGTVPAIALYNNGSWGFINYPGLDAYLTKSAYLDDMQSLSHRLDTDETNIQGLVATSSNLSDKVTELRTDFDQHVEDQTAKEAETDERLTTLETDTEQLKENKLDDAPVDGHFYGRKDGEWSTIEDSGTFVNSEYKDDETESTIKNNTDGISFASNKPVKVTTPEWDKVLNNNIVNVEYLRKNLNLSSIAGSADTNSRYKLSRKVDNFVYKPLKYTSIDTYNLDYIGLAYTSSYIYEWCAQSKAAQQYMHMVAYDKNGTVIECDVPNLEANFTGSSNGHITIAQYHQDTYNEDTQDTVYLPSATGRIFCFKDGAFYGYVKEGENEAPFIPHSSFSGDYYGVGHSPLRGSPRIFISQQTTNADSNLKAFILGTEDDVLKGKSVTLAGPLIYGYRSVASGKNYWWAQNAETNQFMRISKDGGVASFIAQTAEGTALPTTLKGSKNNRLELENGDVIFFVNDTVNFRSYAIWCSDESEDEPVTAIQLPVYYGTSASATGLMWSANFPAFECTNYVYFFQTFAQGNTSTDTTDTAYTQSNAKTYTRIDKVSKAVTALTVPWSQGSREYNQVKVKTKGGYTWVMPFGAYNASSIQSLVLVFDPQGNSRTVDLGTGSTVNWFGCTGLNPYSLKLYGSPNWDYQVASSALCGVTGKGTGIYIAPDMQHVLLFRGDGDFRVFTYDTGDGPKLWNMSNPTAVAGQGCHLSMVPMKHGAVIDQLCSTSQSTSPGTNEAVRLVYITDASTDEALVEPTYLSYQTDSNCLWRKNKVLPKDYTYRNQVLSEVFTEMDDRSGIYGFGAFVEVPEGTTGSTIFLRDGDVNISNVSV